MKEFLFNNLFGILSFIVWLATVVYWFARLNLKVNDLEPLRPKVSEIIKTVDKVDGLIMGMAGLPAKPVVKTTSPMALNDYGQELRKKMDTLKVLDEYVSKLTHQAQEKQMNAYQIQQKCLSFALTELAADLEKKNKALFDQLANLAYQEGIQLETLMQVLGVELRDQVLKAVSERAGEETKQRVLTA